MDEELKKMFSKIANTIRALSMDAVQKANSGHPGLPMGCAELGAYLWGGFLRYNPKNPHWINRDRFVLSAGHGCMLLYSCLHLSGYKLSLDEIKHFRQLGSQTPGHPEYGHTEGVEATTGPLGQGVGTGVGLALGYKLLAQKFNTADQKIFSNKIVVLASDGCIMEGISSEACSLAGHLVLDNLILIYDSNQVCLDGPLPECCSEDTAARYRAYGWDVHELDGYDFDAMDSLFQQVRREQKRPTLIVLHTIIGKGSPHKAGTSKAHGAPLGEEEVKLTKQALGIPLEEFYISQQVKNFFETKLKQDSAQEKEWKELLELWSRSQPALRREFDAMAEKKLPDDLESQLRAFEIKSPLSGRLASQAVINLLAEQMPQLYGGSADLSGSDMTLIKKFPLIAPRSFTGRNIKFGVREFGMGTICSGLALTGMITPFVGTFLTFSDYMRNAIRLACLMKIQVIYQFTHDSIFLGEDGPTHQPIEHYASLRAMPGLYFIRPADNHEVKMAWLAALCHQGPTLLALSRQNLPDVPGTDRPFAQGVGRGAYILKKETRPADFTLISTGSELHLAYHAALELEKLGKSVRVISMPCWELFDAQPKSYQEELLGGAIGKRVSIEAGVDLGWHKYIGREGMAICMESFGASAPAGDLAQHFGFTVDHILEQILT